MSLFPAIDARQFRIRTATRYAAMSKRALKKKIGPMPFDVKAFRLWILEQTGFANDGVIKCRYCNCYIHIWEVEVDHAVPLSRGGALGLHNLELICETDNSQKGSMTPEEYLQLLLFLEDRLPKARVDILRRLRTANKLAAGVAYRNKKAKGKHGTIDEKR